MSKKREHAKAEHDEITSERLEKLRIRISKLEDEMREVGESPYTKLRKAFVIFNQYPEVFAEVPLWKLKYLFFDEWEECTDD